MKKTYSIGGAILFALFLLVAAPGLMGLRLESQFEQAIERTRQQVASNKAASLYSIYKPEIEYHITRHWFSSDIESAITLHLPFPIGEWAGLAPAEDGNGEMQPPRITIHSVTRALHGPIIWDGLPSFAVARLVYDNMNYSIAEAGGMAQPGKEPNAESDSIRKVNVSGYSDINFFGSWTSELTVPPISGEIDTVRYNFGGLNFHTIWHPGKNKTKGGLVIEASTFDLEDSGTYDLTPVRMDMDVALLDDGMTTGEYSLSMASLSFKTPAGENALVKGVSIDGRTRLADNPANVNMRITYHLDGVAADNIRLQDIDLALRIKNLSRAAYTKYTELSIAAAEGMNDIRTLSPEMRRRWLELAHIFISAGPEIEIEEFAYSDDQGRSKAQLMAHIDYDQPIMEKNALPLLMATEGAAHIEAPEAHALRYAKSMAAHHLKNAQQKPDAAALNQAAQMLLAQFTQQGLIKQEKDGYSSTWKLKDGIVSVDGKVFTDLRRLAPAQ